MSSPAIGTAREGPVGSRCVEAEVLLLRLGQRVRDRRMAMQWSYERLSREANVRVGVLERIELGTCNPSMTELINVASKLGMTMADLFSD
jgi:transcriptional regulator with XRE-family HTH domain